MDPDVLFLFAAGFEQSGDGQFIVYFDGPVPRPAPARLYGIRTAYSCTPAGEEAQLVKAWLAANPARQRMRVPAYTRARGVRAVLVTSGYNCGVGSALHGFARDRLVREEQHRERLQSEIERVLGAALGGVFGDGEWNDLQALEDTINAGPVGFEAATAPELTRALTAADGR